MKAFLLFSLLIAGVAAHAENIPVRIQCDTADGQVLKNPSKGMPAPYYYEKQTLLQLGEGDQARVYIIQNENFDLNIGTAHMTGESFNNGYDDAFELAINFDSGNGTFTHGNKKVKLGNCVHTRW